MSRFLKPEWCNLVPYTPGEQPRDMAKLIKLNTNECPYPPSPAVVDALSGKLAETLRLYPDPECKALKTAFAKAYSVDPSCVTVSNGSDEVLAFAFQAYGAQGVAYPDVSYGFYKVFAETYGLTATEVALNDDFTLSVDDYMDVAGTVFIANPNAPTGLAVSASDIERLLAADRSRLVVIDEAYVDFGAESVVPLINKYDNLLVVGTFSKSRAMAGARLGFAFACPSIIEDIEKVRYSFNPYNINTLTMAAGIAALLDKAYYDDVASRIITTRENLKSQLKQLGLAVTDSVANFIFAGDIKGLSGEDYYHKLRNMGILVRYFGSPKLKNRVRITIGTQEQADALVRATKTIIEEI